MEIPKNSGKLFLASKIALITTAMTFAIRANLIGDLGAEFELNAKEIGIVFGTAFWGFTLSIIAGGTLTALIGLSRIISMALIFHFSGILLTVFATGFWSLFMSTLFVGLGNGFIEAACNPLISELYPDQKTKKLNQLHVWFPGGIVIGGLVAYLLDNYGFSWKYQMLSILFPTVIYGLLFFKEKFPQISTNSDKKPFAQMVNACLNPIFILMLFCMLLTASTELGTNQWIAELLGNTGFPSILLLVFINGLMAAGRSLAGPVEKKLSPLGMLLFSSLTSALGLYMLGLTEGYYLFISAAIFAIGICYFWPTMLGFVSEYLPQTGPLGLSLMGGAGMLSVAFILPFIGNVYDSETLNFIPDGYNIESLKLALPDTAEAALWAKAKLKAGASTLKMVSLLPCFLSVVFSFLFIYFNKKSKTKLHKAL